MKTFRKATQYLLILILSLSSVSCLKTEFEEILFRTNETAKTNYGEFDYSTVKEYFVTVTTLNYLNQPIDGVYIELYTENPLGTSGLFRTEAETNKIYKGITDRNGLLKCQINPPSYADSLFVLTYYIGLPSLQAIPLSGEHIEISIGGRTALKGSPASSLLKKAPIPAPSFINGYYQLGGWNNYGVPDYLEQVNDPISNDFLADVNASLPERDPLPESHPQYLAGSNDASLVLIEECEVWVTFVHEGAGWHNSLAYYTYPTGNPPAAINDISDRTIIFPDVSLHQNGLAPGNKVQLFYLDPETNEYSDTFPSGISVGWSLIAQGWSSQSQTVTDGVYTHYSNVNINAEASEELRKHNVLLYDEVRELLLLGFEDIRRDNSGCDHDFNDAVFYTSVSPVSAVDLSLYQPIDNPVDTDNDGTSNVFDEYPNDPGKAFNNYYPAEDIFGTLVYEDLWPYRGDYDFNDMVVDYNFNQVTNSQNEVTGLIARIVLRAIGATYHNAFGVSINTSPGNVASVSGQLNTKGYLNLAANGTENGQSKAVIIFFDDAFNALPYPGIGLGVNTHPEYPFVTPDTMRVDIDFTNPVAFIDIGVPPYNPFIIIDRNRSIEVHLPNLPPTDLVDLEIMGTGDDDSDIGAAEYYVSDAYLPWAINLPVRFDYPIEKQTMQQSHLMFNSWATSLGYNRMDWYHDKLNYRNNAHIYSKRNN
jgi:LruC domain-containing protein